MEPPTRIVLIRHGQTVWNREDRVRGQLDPDLDETGLQQARATAKYVARRWPVVAVYSSPLQRAMRTAEAVARAQDLDVQTLPELLDLSFGQWEGLLFAEARLRYPEMYRGWREAPHTVHFPDGESLDDVRRRVTAGLDKVAARHGGQSTALVGHTVVNRVLLCVVMGLGNENFWCMGQDPCAVNVFDVAEDGTRTLLLLNDTCHLA